MEVQIRENTTLLNGDGFVSQKKGGLGLKDLTKFNISLMCKWWWKIESTTSHWHDFMSRKYLRGSGVFYSKNRPGDSPLWTYMQKNKRYLSSWQKNASGGWENDKFLAGCLVWEYSFERFFP
jgi:hypothetical protein